MITREPQIAQQPSTQLISSSQTFSISCRAFLLRNLGTDTVIIDEVMPMPEGDVHQEAATWDGVLCYRMQIRFEEAEGKTQKLLIRQIYDVGDIASNQ